MVTLYLTNPKGGVTVSEEIITHSSLVDKLIVRQNIDIPVRSGKIKGYEADKKKSIRTISHRRAVAKAGANIEVALHKLSDGAVLLQNAIYKLTPKSFLIFFALVGSLLTTSYETAREKLFVLHRTGCKVSHGVTRKIACYSFPRVAGMLFLIASVFVVASTTIVGVGLQVSVDGEPVGFVSRRSDFTDVVSRVEKKAGQILGYPYTVDSEITYSFEMFNRNEIIGAQAAERLLFSAITDVTQAYVITVDGEIIGAYPHKDIIDETLDSMLAAYEADGVNTIEFLRDVEVSFQYTNVKNVCTASQISKLLAQNIRDEESYTVQAGDNFTTISSQHGLSTAALSRMNPEVDVNRIAEGQVLVVNEAIPLMSVKTVETVVYTEAIPYNTEYVDDSSMYTGTTKVKVSGVNGLKEITAEIVNIDGSQQEKSIVNEKVLTEPTTEVISKGTKKRDRKSVV